MVALVGVSVAALAGVAGADRSLYRHISVGEINGNGAFDVFFSGNSADGAHVFFLTDEQLITGDTDASQDLYERSGGTTKRVSAGQVNGNGAFDAGFVGKSRDGTRAYFRTNERLVSADTDSSQDVYERSAGTTKVVSAGQINGNGAFPAAFGGASADATRVFFHTNEPLVSGDTDASRDIYERAGGSTKRVSVGQINGNGAFDAIFAHVSADGTRVFFRTNESLVSGDTDGVMDVYERSGGTTKRVSAGQIHGNGVFDVTFAGASADGTRVFFQTNEQLVSTDTDSVQDVYERSAGTTKLVSAGQVNGNGAFAAAFAGASADGTRVFFVTPERLIGNDNDSAQDIYERSSGTTKRVSVGQINGNGPVNAYMDGASADGTHVFFTTAESLVSADTDGVFDVYERSAGSTKRVSAGQINGNAQLEAVFNGASADGSRVFFHTFEKLVSGDKDSFDDIYERFGGTTSRVSIGSSPLPEWSPFFGGTTVDGSGVFYTTGVRILVDDTDNSIDLYGAYVGP